MFSTPAKSLSPAPSRNSSSPAAALYYSPSPSTSALPFFTSSSNILTQIHHHPSQTTQLLSNRLLHLIFSSPSFVLNNCRIDSFSNKFFFRPTFRKRITNFVFFGAFLSACLCVGGQSIHPNGGFHSRNRKMYDSESHYYSQQQPLCEKNNDDFNHASNAKPKNKLLAILCPLWLLENLNSFYVSRPVDQLDSNPPNSHSFKQRKWIEEESP